MPDKTSLFSKHMRLIEQDPATWSDEDRLEFDRLKSLRLPPLPERRSWLSQFRFQWQVGVATAAVLTLTVIFLIPKKESLNYKGSLQVNVMWDRDGKVQALTADSALKDGDKIGASVISSEDSFAYWAVTDNKMKIISDLNDMEETKLILQPGVSEKFKSSFSLVPPNQGENLIVIVCPKIMGESQKPSFDTILNQEFVTRLITEQKIKASNCVFVGYRLRSLP